MNKYARQQGKTELGGMAKTANVPTDSCHRKKKDIKKSITDREDDIALMREVLTRDLSDYSSVNETIGRLYMNLVYLKEELANYKKRGNK